MNFGKKIQEFRKQKNVTQEELAAELGVTAAAVSKWENNYTLPDILMLCALADYFAVTTDALLGRIPMQGQAVIVADSEELGEKIKAVAAKYGIGTTAIVYNTQEAVSAMAADDTITYLLMGIRSSNPSHVHMHFDSNTLHLSPDFHLDMESMVLHTSPDMPVHMDPRKIKLYISVSNTDQDILNELRSALQNDG